MNKTLNRVRIGFVVAFAAICAGIFAWAFFVTWPIANCDKQGKWWSRKYNACEKVLYLPNVTHRAPGTKTPKPLHRSDPVMVGKAP